ncbi:hypothetical protein [Chitinophaga agri]|uniref:Uncharacterized protein n=1 Tax=Chitinophaga agri TaxID=2703787 RepID=A0A6B9ZB82_9BACT|nr:hypothetical protein [Chitinophaga agri]QHS58365.1 hypothetical protein GWR21_01770 [Chitinophaga agri]
MNNPMSENGHPLPERPATVPVNACFIQGENNHPYWVLRQLAPTKDQYTGEYTEWDPQGKLLLKRIYHDDSGIPEEVFMADVCPEHTDNDFYAGGSVISRSRRYSYNGCQFRQLFFDESGQLLYELKKVFVPTRVTRCYYNHILVFEMIAAQDQTPVSAKYFYPDGTVMTSYLSNGENRGTWTMCNTAGQVIWAFPRENEIFVSNKEKWPDFLPECINKPSHPTIDSYIDAVVKKFTEEYDNYVTNTTIQSLPIPDYLQAELDRISWHQLKTFVGTGEDLPVTINGLLTGNDYIADICAERIWCRVGKYISYYDHYDAAYATATILAHILQVATAPSRLLALLYRIISIPSLRTAGYAELVASMAGIVPKLQQWASSEDHVTARHAQHILLHAGQGRPETETLFQQEWQNVTHPVWRREYTLYCLGRYYEISDSYTNMRSHFTTAFQQELLPTLQTIMAIYLVRDAEKRSEKSWIDSIIRALDEPDTILKSLNVIETFTGWDPEGFLIMILEDAGVKR